MHNILCKACLHNSTYYCSPLHNFVIYLLPKIQKWYNTTLTDLVTISKHKNSRGIGRKARNFELWMHPEVNLDSPRFITYTNMQGSSSFWYPHESLRVFYEDRGLQRIQEILYQYKITHENSLTEITRTILEERNVMVEALTDAMDILVNFNDSNQFDFRLIRLVYDFIYSNFFLNSQFQNTF